MNESYHDDAADMAQTEMENTPKRGPIRKVLRWAAWSTLGLVGFSAAAVGGGMYFLSTESGGRWVTSTANSVLSSLPSGLSGSIASFEASLPFNAAISGLELKDKNGVWLTAKRFSLAIDWAALPEAFVISEITFDSPQLQRAPELTPSTEAEAEPVPAADPRELLDQLGGFLQNWPSWLPALRINNVTVQHADIAQPAFGLSVKGSVAFGASAGPGGLAATLDAKREGIAIDADDARFAVMASLSPQLELALDVKGSDMGFASQFLPASLEQPVLSLVLKGKGTLKDWNARLESMFHVQDKKALGLSADLGFGLMESGVKAISTLRVDSGEAASALWKLAGQKNGSFSANIKAQAELADSIKADAAVDLKLADVEWAEPLLSAVIGPEASFSMGASAKPGPEGGISVKLDGLKAQSKQLDVDASGELALAGSGLASPASKVDMHAGFSLADVAVAAAGFSGDAKIDADITGPFTALQAQLDIMSRRLHTSGTRFDDLNAHVSLPEADIPRLMTEIPRVLDSTLKGSSSIKGNGSTLLAGQAQASLRMNDHPLLLASDWSITEMISPAPGLLFSLTELDAKAAQSTAVRGRLAAQMPYVSAVPREGTLAAMVGMPMPLLNGHLSIDIGDWKTLGEMTGVGLSGAPMDARLEFSAEKMQSLRWECTLPSFQMDGPTQTSLTSFQSTMDVRDLWGRPDANIQLSAAEVRIPDAVLNDISAEIEGGLDNLKVHAASHGDVLSDIEAHWKPGELFIERLSAQAVPALAGLAGDTPLGLSFDTPATLHYDTDRFELAPCEISFLPAGKVTASGSWSPEKFSISARLAELDLKPFQPLVPDIPAGTASMEMQFHGTPQKPSGELLLSLKEIQAVGSSIPPVDCDVRGTLAVRGKRRMFDASVDIPEHSRDALGLQQAEVRASLPFTSPAEGVAMPDMDGPLDASIRLKGDLGQIWRLVPSADQRLAGQSDIDITVGGKVSAPVVTAHAAVKDGRFLDIAQGVELTDIQLRADAEKMDVVRMIGDKAKIALSASDGRQGSVKMLGWFDPTDMSLAIKGSLDKLSPLHRPDIAIQLSGDLGVSGTASSPKVFADIIVDKGQVQLSKLPGGGITTLDIDEPQQADMEEKASAPGRLDVRVRIPNQFFLRGFGLDCEWQGDLKVQGALDRPEVTGGLQAIRGTLDILGKNFKLAEGAIDFDGGWPVSPLLNIDMEYVTGAVTANIKVGGTASDPKLTLSSQPELPQDEVLSQIMFGQSSGGLSHVQALQLASGAAALAGFGGADLMGLGRKVLGVDVFKVNSDNDGEDSDVSRTSLEMGTYVLDNIYVGVEQGIGKESETGAVVEIELLPNLEAQAKASGSKTEVGLEWTLDY